MPSAIHNQCLTFLDASHWNVSDESRSTVAKQFGCLRIHRRFYDALAGFIGPVGLAFQIKDDLLDVLGDASTLGKAAGADSIRAKPTHPAVLGVAASQERMHRLHAQALAALEPFGERAAPLRALAAWLLARSY